MPADNDNFSVAEPSPAALAMDHLGKLASAGMSGERLVTLAAQITAGWQKAGADAEAMREGITTILSNVDDGVTAAEQLADEAATARRQVDALRALQEALAVMAERLG